VAGQQIEHVIQEADAGRPLPGAGAIGVRVLLVHAKHERAKSWYERYGFEESPTDPLHLMMLMKDIRAFVERHPST